MTDQQIVDRALSLARTFYALQGYEVPKGYKFYLSHHPQEQYMWSAACVAFEEIEGTDVTDALAEVLDGELTK